jgi:transposase-like protein
MRKRKRLQKTDLGNLKTWFRDGDSVSTIAKRLGVTNEAVFDNLDKMGLRKRKRKRRPLPEGVKKRIVELYQEGLNTHQIADEVGVASPTARYILMKRGVKLRPPGKRHKLNQEQKQELVRLYAKERWVYADLAFKFGISPSTVGEILKELGIKARHGWARYRTQVWTDRRGREHVFKSTWELAYAKHLDAEGLNWDYEAASFGVRGYRCYTPDFFILDDEGHVERLVEVKGWLEAKDTNRILAFLGQYPRFLGCLEIVGPGQLAEMGLIEPKYRNHPMADEVERFRGTVNVNPALAG